MAAGGAALASCPRGAGRGARGGARLGHAPGGEALRVAHQLEVHGAVEMREIHLWGGRECVGHGWV
jgi:hypothetical protein